LQPTIWKIKQSQVSPYGNIDSHLTLPKLSTISIVALSTQKQNQLVNYNFAVIQRFGIDLTTILAPKCTKSQFKNMRSSVVIQQGSDEELLLLALMKNSREIKAFFNSKFGISSNPNDLRSVFGKELDQGSSIRCINRH